MTTSTINLGPVCRDATTDSFFSATAKGQFPICRCSDCGVVGGPQQTQCASCGSAALAWEAASGRAVVRSYIVNHQRAAPGETLAPVVVAIGELAEGPWWWAQVADVDPDAVTEGMRLVLDFARSGEEMVPIFRPDT
jgi:uncharacterized OB-fold protein